MSRTVTTPVVTILRLGDHELMIDSRFSYVILKVEHINRVFDFRPQKVLKKLLDGARRRENTITDRKKVSSQNGKTAQVKLITR